jgi:hypothetical protein
MTKVRYSEKLLKQKIAELKEVIDAFPRKTKVYAKYQNYILMDKYVKDIAKHAQRKVDNMKYEWGLLDVEYITF